MATDALGAAKAVGMLKDWPLWLLIAIAISLSVFVAVPPFLAMAPGNPMIPVFALVVAWILVGARVTSLIPGWIAERRAAHERNTKFVLTPVENGSFWHIAKQQDGSFITQLSLRGMVMNRDGHNLHLMGAKIVSPRIRGRVLQSLVTTQAPDGSLHGTAYVSGHHVPTGQALPFSALILVNGMPRQRDGVLKIVAEFRDANANSSRLHMEVALAGTPGPANTGPLRWLGL